ncbi:MAG: hypothetical protein Q9159_005479 [Coniocarpon cinnabarinum]
MAFRIASIALLATLPLASAVPGVVRRGSDPGSDTAADSASSLAATVTLPYGQVAGTTTSLPTATAPVNKFLGVPYAKSPPQRFTPPSQPDQFDAPIDATAFSASCIQQFTGSPAARNFTESVFNEPPPQESEDCLYLNVYAPSTPPSPDGRAVLFWIYGGGLEFGNAGQPAYDGSAFAAYQDVILVAPNYRTNVFGFVNSPELPVTEQNLGFLDQRFALQWVQDNIDKFGGDPKKVTIFGESAGALSTDTLLTSYSTEDAPFRGAILESGQASYGDAGSVLPGTRISPFAQLAAALNCTAGQSNLTCVRNAPVDTIRQIIDDNSIEFQPVVDNVTDFGSGALARAAGNFARVPILGGTNYQEGRVFEVGQNNFTAFLQNTFGTTAPQQIPLIEAAYGPVGDIAGVNTDFDLISAVYTDLNFQCGQALQANQTAAAGVPAWRYLYNASFPSTTIFDGSGVYHSSEIVSVFQTYGGGPINPNVGPLGLQQTQIPPTAQQVALSQYMNSVWGNFAKNPMGGPGWPEIGRFNESLGVLGLDGSSGVTVVDPSVVSYRCPLFYPVYEAAVGGVPLPGIDS